jgi:hypothetical protein
LCSRRSIGLSDDDGRDAAVASVLSISIALLLIAGIDSPGGGFFRMRPENQLSAAKTLGADQE